MHTDRSATRTILIPRIKVSTVQFKRHWEQVAYWTSRSQRSVISAMVSYQISDRSAICQQWSAICPYKPFVRSMVSNLSTVVSYQVSDRSAFWSAMYTSVHRWSALCDRSLIWSAM